MNFWFVYSLLFLVYCPFPPRKQEEKDKGYKESTNEEGFWLLGKWHKIDPLYEFDSQRKGITQKNFLQSEEKSFGQNQSHEWDFFETPHHENERLQSVSETGFLPSKGPAEQSRFFTPEGGAKWVLDEHKNTNVSKGHQYGSDETYNEPNLSAESVESRLAETQSEEAELFEEEGAVGGSFVSQHRMAVEVQKIDGAIKETLEMNITKNLNHSKSMPNVVPAIIYSILLKKSIQIEVGSSQTGHIEISKLIRNLLIGDPHEWSGSFLQTWSAKPQEQKELKSLGRSSCYLNFQFLQVTFNKIVCKLLILSLYLTSNHFFLSGVAEKYISVLLIILQHNLFFIAECVAKLSILEILFYFSKYVFSIMVNQMKTIFFFLKLFEKYLIKIEVTFQNYWSSLKQKVVSEKLEMMYFSEGASEMIYLIIKDITQRLLILSKIPERDKMENILAFEQLLVARIILKSMFETKSAFGNKLSPELLAEAEAALEKSGQFISKQDEKGWKRNKFFI